jgi:hypothetical protein
MKAKQINNKVFENFGASHVFFVHTVHQVRDFSDIGYMHKCINVMHADIGVLLRVLYSVMVSKKCSLLSS